MSQGVSVRPIGKMLELSNAFLPWSEATGILDNGCGPGPVISRIINDYGSKIPKSASIDCSDFSPPMIDQMKETKATEIQTDPDSPWSRVNIHVQNAMDLQSIADGSKSHVTAGFVYFMTPDPQKCLSETRRVLKDGGVLACSSWKSTQWLDIMDVTLTMAPDIPWPRVPEEWSSESAMKQELETGGFRDVEAHEVPVTMTFDTHEAFNELLLCRMPHMVAATKDFTPEQMVELKKRTMDEAKRLAPSPPYSLSGRALVAVGRK